MTLGLGAGNGRAKNFQPQLRLAQGGSEVSAGIKGAWRIRPSGEIRVVGRATVAEGVHQHQPGEPHAVFRRTFHLGLVLLVNLAALQL